MSEQDKINAIVEAIENTPDGADVSAEAGRLILKAQENHARRQDQIRSVIQHMRDGGLLQVGEGGVVIEPDDERHPGAIVGMEIALHLFGDFPIKIRDLDDAEEE